MNRHANPGETQDSPVVPEPTYAERARTLVQLARVGSLSTNSRRHPGYPFGSVMPYAPDLQGEPVFLISSMAVHAQNLEDDPRASLLVTQAGWEGDPLAAGRVTLVGEAVRLSREEVRQARAPYLGRHPNAGYWVDYDDFGFFRLSVKELYFVGGFAAMGWIPQAEYHQASPDPLAEVSARILDHMNQDHTDALKRFAGAFAGIEPDEVWMVSVDRLGFKLRIRSGTRFHGARVPFPREVLTAEDARKVLVEMLERLREEKSDVKL